MHKVMTYWNRILRLEDTNKKELRLHSEERYNKLTLVKKMYI